MKVVVTGASGFLGRYLINVLRDSGHEITAASRSRVEIPGIFYAPSPELGPCADWRDTLQGVDAVVHLAGRAHVTSEKANLDTEQSYFRINTEGTKALAHQAAAAGVKHFVLLSSCHAVRAQSDDMMTGDTKPHPVSAYGRSKLAAEKAIQEELRTSGCAWTILRPPLVYGRGNQANFGLLLKLVKTGIPLPLASVRNRRSFIYVENLVDLISKCLGNAKAFGKVYLPSDGEDVSTPELIRAIARANAGVEQGAGSREQGAGAVVASGEWRVAREKNRKTELNRQAASATSGNSPATSYPLPATPREARLFHFPPSLLRAAGRLPGLGALRKLTSSLYVDSEPLRRDLGWTPPFTMEEGLRRTLAKTKE
jgi:nucleoside-diphosphate-sugar epimerase